MNIVNKTLLTSLILYLGISQAKSEELELEQATNLGSPYCVDMRNGFERDRTSASTSTISLTRLFKCRKTYLLPLSVKPNEIMLKRYAKKFETFRGHKLLVWCTHGVRTNIMQAELQKTGISIHSLKGGTLHIANVLQLRN